MKRVLVMLVAGTALSGAAALYATSTAQAVESPPMLKDGKGNAAR